MKRFERLAPRGNGFDREPFDTYFERVRQHLRFIPKSVVEQWLHRHWEHTPYDWLPLDRLRFTLVAWPLERVLRIGEGAERLWSEGWSHALGTDPLRRSTWLAKYMLENGTWPEAIIVLDNAEGLVQPNGESLARYHLIEGHMRSAYLDHLARTGAANPEHLLWLMRVESR